VKFFIDNWFLFATALVSGGLLVWPMLSRNAGGGSRVTTAQAVQMINREKAMLIDVSEPDEFAAAHAGGARNVLARDLGRSAEEQDLADRGGLPDRRAGRARRWHPAQTRVREDARAGRRAGRLARGEPADREEDRLT
jgi:hypothetical protein